MSVPVEQVANSTILHEAKPEVFLVSHSKRVSGNQVNQFARFKVPSLHKIVVSEVGAVTQTDGNASIVDGEYVLGQPLEGIFHIIFACVSEIIREWIRLKGKLDVEVGERRQPLQGLE